MTLNMLIGILEQGLIYGIMAMGLLITYRILDFPDLTVDSSFPLGAAVSATLTLQGVAPWLTLLIGCAAGGIAGLITGLIHVKCRVLRFAQRHHHHDWAVLPQPAYRPEQGESPPLWRRYALPQRLHEVAVQGDFPLHHAHHHLPDCC